MAISDQKFHEIVFQLLFSLQMGDHLEGDLISFLMRELTVTRKVVRNAYRRAKTVFEWREQFDEKIAATSKAYALERIGRVERIVLHLAIYELWLEADQPREKILSEALRLTRKFSTKEATAYVNAILDSETLIGPRFSLSSPEEASVE